MISAGDASGRCITGACAHVTAANVIGTAAASGNAGSDSVGVAKAIANDEQYIGVLAGTPTACVVCVGAAGGPGGLCIAGGCTRAPAPCLISKAATSGIAGSDTVGVATAG